MTIRRRHQSQATYLITPSLALNLVGLWVIHVDPDCGERLTVPTLVLLGLGVYHHHLSTLLPRSSLVTPLIVRYNVFCMWLAVAGVLVSVVCRMVGTWRVGVPEGCTVHLDRVACVVGVCRGEEGAGNEDKNKVKLLIYNQNYSMNTKNMVIISHSTKAYVNSASYKYDMFLACYIS